MDYSTISNYNSSLATITQMVYAGNDAEYPSDIGLVERTRGMFLPRSIRVSSRLPPRPSARLAGTYGTAQLVTISTTTNGATIRYTTDGSTPSEIAGTVYSSPVTISADLTLQAIAYATGYCG